MSEMHLKQLGFTYSVHGQFIRNKEELKNLCWLEIQTYRNGFDKACFQHDMAYGKSKDLTKRTKSDKDLRDKAFKMWVIENMMFIKED